MAGRVTCEPSPSSPASEASTSASNEPASKWSASVRPTSGAGPCSPPGSPASPAGTTYVAFMPHRTLQPDGTILEGFAEREVCDALHGPTGNKEPLIVSTSSPAASPARTCPSPDDEPASPENAAASSGSSTGSSRLFDPDGYSSRTSPACSLPITAATSPRSSVRWTGSGSWAHGEFSTAVTSECRSADAACSSSAPTLASILEANAAPRYSLSARAAAGIIARAERRGRTLPVPLLDALRAVSTTHVPEADS